MNLKHAKEYAAFLDRREAELINQIEDLEHRLAETGDENEMWELDAQLRAAQKKLNNVKSM